MSLGHDPTRAPPRPAPPLIRPALLDGGAHAGPGGRVVPPVSRGWGCIRQSGSVAWWTLWDRLGRGLGEAGGGGGGERPLVKLVEQVGVELAAGVAAHLAGGVGG